MLGRRIRMTASNRVHSDPNPSVRQSLRRFDSRIYRPRSGNRLFNPGLDRIVVIDDYSTARGGATALSLLSAKLFRALDIPVTYICGDDGANAELASMGISVVPFQGRDLLNAE